MPQPSSLTPIDILNHRFVRRISGYSIPEVDEFVQKTAEALEASRAEAAEHREKAAIYARELEQYRNLETAMRDALTLAQQAAEETRTAAKLQSELVVQEAHRHAAELEVQIDRVKREHRVTVQELKTKLRSHLEWLEDQEPDVRPASLKNVPLSDSISEAVVSRITETV